MKANLIWVLLGLLFSCNADKKNHSDHLPGNTPESEYVKTTETLGVSDSILKPYLAQSIHDSVESMLSDMVMTDSSIPDIRPPVIGKYDNIDIIWTPDVLQGDKTMDGLLDFIDALEEGYPMEEEAYYYHDGFWNDYLQQGTYQVFGGKGLGFVVQKLTRLDTLPYVVPYGIYRSMRVEDSLRNRVFKVNPPGKIAPFLILGMPLVEGQGHAATIIERFPHAPLQNPDNLGDSQVYELNGRRYSLALVGDVQEEKEEEDLLTVEGVDLILSIDTLSQSLLVGSELKTETYWKEGDTYYLPNIAIELAGDLDGDEKLDLIVSVGYYGCMYALFLSSQAEEGEIVKRVASYVGCMC